VPIPTHRADALERLRRSLASEASPHDADLFADFVTAVARSGDAAFFARSTSEIAHLLSGTLSFIETRREDEILVRAIAGSPATLESCMRDQPFIYDTLRLLLAEEGATIVGGFHAVVPVRRSETGRVERAGAKGLPLESVIHLALDGVATAERAQALEAAVRARLELARAAVADFALLRVAAEELRERIELVARRGDRGARQSLDEAGRFLGWLLDQHFIFMACTYVPAARTGEPEIPGPSQLSRPLGTYGKVPFTSDDGLRALAVATSGPAIVVRKIQTLSRIHRAGPLDQILVRWFREDGAPAGLVVFEGLFTYRALGRPSAEIPLIGPILGRLLEDAGLPPDSYRGRLLRYAFSVLPAEFLFAARYEDVSLVADRVVAAVESRSTEAAHALDPSGRSAYVFVAMPREKYDEELRAAIQGVLLERFHATSASHGVSLTMLETAVLHFRLSGDALVLPEIAPLSAELAQLATPWRARLGAALEKRFPHPRAQALLARYEEAFPEAYVGSTSAARAVEDIVHLEELQQKSMAFDLFLEEVLATPAEHSAAELLPVLRIYEREDVILSDLLPVLEHFGLLISSQYETRVSLPGGRVHTIDTFRISGVRGLPDADVLGARERLLAGVEAVFAGRFTASPLNALLLRSQVSWRDVGLVRSCLAYLRQIGFRFPPSLVQEVLLANADLVRRFANLFRIKFDPRFAGTAADRALALREARDEYLARLSGVADYAADSILRSLLNVVDAAVRTNLYCRGETTDNFAIKFDCSAIEMLRGSGPQPLYEIFVHHTSVHGVHLRGGKVARGGLRYSDRIDDYRTEILGLMRTQMVKNSIIVPVGAKGGFVLQKPLEDPKERRAQADACYRLFVSALLDVTDNIVDGKVVRPVDVVCYDDEDPYLVVAADKGTAHLSDVANALARERGFWLGDAFASGGSNGYDHKATGITARGAWVCARRHLREMGVDPDRDVITVVGIGDMSGDVFGNGLLLSKRFKLIGAFDHRHIFLDPDPDPERSWAERDRLFRLPGSSWADYDPSVLSKGGGVFPRGAKQIPLSPELRARLGVADATMSGEAMIRALLMLDVDLLWNGGIGTYIKANHEDHRDAGDRANDSVRVDGRDVRARVVAEGGNLGMTQAGRREYCARGGRCNTDAIDNSGGVDLSDHEVNLKILFAPVVRGGRLTLDARNALLAEMEAEVVQSVLANNRSQSRLLSLDQRRSRRDPLRFVRASEYLARVSPFDLHALSLPDERTLAARTQDGGGLLRAEIAALAGYAKIYVKRELLRSELDPRSARLWPMLRDYFPRRLAEPYKDDIAKHLLAREIGHTVLTNLLVGDVGVSFFPELEEWSGRSTAEVAKAYVASADAANAWFVKDEVAALERERSLQDVVYPALLRIEDALEAGATLLLSGLGGGTLETPGGAGRLLAGVPENLPVDVRARVDASAAELIAANVPAETARKIASFDLLVPALLAASAAETGKTAAQGMFAMLFAAAETTRLLELERRIGALKPKNRADAGAYRTLRLRFLSLLGRSLVDVQKVAPRGTAIGAEVSRALGQDLSIAALVTLEDRVTRLANA
jgi:glutamate dehydrogenase